MDATPTRRPGVGVIAEGLHPEVVASAEEPTAGAVPDGEGEIAEQPPRAGLAPLLVRAEDEFGVTEPSGVTLPQPEEA